MRASSADDGARSARPITASRTEPCPTRLAKLTAGRNASTFERKAPSGRGDEPSWPSTSVVTPCRT